MFDLNDKIMSANTLKKTCFRWRFFGKKIVFTNGCFDIIHQGHINYLIEAKKMGGKLVVGLNSDSSVQKIKGNNRPIQDENSRAKILASLGFIDAVILFKEETPQKLIQNIRPDILIKGSDYLVNEIKGSEYVLSYGGTVKTIELTSNYSTSKIIKKIKTG